MATKQEKFRNAIIDRILRGEFVNGAFLPCERVLAESYGFSRITVRTALQKMVQQKILCTIPNKGYQVVRIPTRPLPDTLNIGALWCTNPLSEYSYTLYQAAERKAKEQHYGLFVKSSGIDNKVQAAMLSDLLEIKTDGLLVVPTFHPDTGYMTLANYTMLKMLRKAGKPLVMVDRAFPETDLPCVLNDEYGGGQMVAEHFARLGHKRVALFASDVSYYYISQQRLGGFLEGCRERNMKTYYFNIPTKELLSGYRLSVYKRYREQFFAFVKEHKVTAVLVNLVTLYDVFLKDFERSGLKLDIVLYDTKLNTPVRGNVWRVERPMEEIASQATALLLDEIRTGASGPVRQIRLKPEIKALPKIKKTTKKQR